MDGSKLDALAERLTEYGLQGRQLAFVMHYLINGRNATRAALAAGYRGSGVSVQAHRLLRTAKISRILAMVQQAETHLLAAWFQRMADIAYSADIADLEPFLLGKATLEQLRKRGVDTRLVKRACLRRGRHGEFWASVELHDPLVALDKLLRAPAPEPPGRDEEHDERMELVIGLLQAQLDEINKKPYCPGIPPASLPPTK